MKRRRMALLMIAVIMLLSGMTALADEPAFEVKIDGILESGGVLVEGILPGMSREEAEAIAQLPILLEGAPVDKADFQFEGDEFIGICLTTEDIDALNAVYDRLVQQMGQPEGQMNGDDQNASMVQQWTLFEEGRAVRFVVTVTMHSGVPVSGSLQVSWLDYERFADELNLKIARIEGLKENGFLLIDGLLPDMSREEAEAAGIVFEEEPFGTRTGEGRDFTTTDWLADDKAMRIALAGHVAKSAFFQFDDGRLTGVQLIFDDEQAMIGAEEALMLELGEVQETASDARGRLLVWQAELNGTTARVYLSISYDGEGGFYQGSVQVSCFPADLYPDWQDK